MRAKKKTLKDRIEVFEKIMWEYSEFGASDTEPRFHFKNALYVKIHNGKDRIPRSANEWELFSTMQGVNPVARRLSNLLTTLVKSIPNSPHREVQDVIDEYALSRE